MAKGSRNSPVEGGRRAEAYGLQLHSAEAGGRPSFLPEARLRERYGDRLVDAALKKLHWVNELRTAILRRHGRSTNALVRAVAARAKRKDPTLKVTERTLQLWRKAHTNYGLAGLVFGGASDARDGFEGRPPGGRSPGAALFFLTLYGMPIRLTLKRCHELTLERAEKVGWTWPESPSTTSHWLRETADVAALRLARAGG